MFDDSNISQLYKEICSLHGLKQVIESFTRITEKTSTLIEHICPGAHLPHAHLSRAHLSRAHFPGAHLPRHVCPGTFARGPFIQGPFIQGTFIQGTFIQGTFIQGTFARGTFQLFETLSTNLVNNLPSRQTSFEWIVSVHTNEV